MNKKCKALAAAGLIGAALGAQAQSSVTVFGTLDVNMRYVKADGQRRLFTESTNGINSAQFGIRGQEDLGGGLGAGFLLLGDIAPDTGTMGDASRNKFWNRQSFLRFYGNFGEVRLGRDYTPTYLQIGIYDIAGNVGLGSLLHIRQMYGGSRMDNSIGYITPNTLGGFYADLRAAASEAGATLDRPGRYVGARLGYKSGPLDIAVAGADQRFDKAFTIFPAAGTGNPGIQANAGDRQKTYNIGGTYDFGVVKLVGLYNRETLRDKRENLYSIGAIVPIGLAELSFGYDRDVLKNPGLDNTLQQFKAKYVYNLSKRTALYTAASRLSNDHGRITLPSAAGNVSPGGKSVGVDFGIRHFF
jgi:predicted porin